MHLILQAVEKADADEEKPKAASSDEAPEGSGPQEAAASVAKRGRWKF